MTFLLARLETHAGGADFLAAYAENRPGCLLLDMAMPGMTGLEVQAALKSRGFAIPILFLTGHGDIPLTVRALQAGAVDFLEKPFAMAAFQRASHAVDGHIHRNDNLFI